MFRTSLDQSKLVELAAELGSDVPFFIKLGPAICRGRGERLEFLQNGSILPIVVAKPPIGLSTAAVFRNCEIPKEPEETKSLQISFELGDPYNIGKQIRNRLEEFARPLTPWIAQLESEFARTSSLGHQMSGSGTSYFGIFANNRSALRAAKQLSSRLPTTSYSQAAPWLPAALEFVRIPDQIREFNGADH